MTTGRGNSLHHFSLVVNDLICLDKYLNHFNNIYRESSLSDDDFFMLTFHDHF